MCKKIDMTGFTTDQLMELIFAEERGVDISRFADPKYSAERMEVIAGYLMEGFCEEGLGLLLDEAVSDTEAWNVLIGMLHGRTLEEILMKADEKEPF